METEVLFLVIDLQLKAIENTLDKFNPECRQAFQQELAVLSSKFLESYPQARELLNDLKKKHTLRS